MRGPGYILRLLPLMLLALAAVSCDFRGLDEQAVEMEVRLYFPDMAMTKAEVGEVGATSEERLLTSMHLWVFLHNTGTLIATRQLSQSEIEDSGLSAGIETRLTVNLIGASKPSDYSGSYVDVYAVFNAASAGLTIGNMTEVTPVQLDSHMISGGYFGVDNLVQSVPAGGLPMAGVAKNVQIGGSFPVFSIPTVTVTRAVSKLRFVFCQLLDENGRQIDDYAITQITLGGDVATSERLFTEQTYSASGRYDTNLFDISGYSTLNKTFTGADLPSAIAGNKAPGDLLFSNFATAQEYETAINNAVRTGSLTQWGLTYLRETDRRLSGSITYTVGGGAPKTATFTMSDDGDFTRNHSWIIYCYFIGGRLYVQPVLVPWIAAHDRFAFATQSFTRMLYEPWLRYDKDKNPSTWNDTYMGVAYGYQGGGTSGLPLYSPVITVESINSYDIRVQVDNDKFQLVTTNQDRNSFTVRGQSFLISGSQQKQFTYIYVVPVDNTDYQEPASIARLFLTELHGTSGVPPENIPYNHNLPGDEDHTSIFIHKISATAYSETLATRPAAGTGYYWIVE